MDVCPAAPPYAAAVKCPPGSRGGLLSRPGSPEHPERCVVMRLKILPPRRGEVCAVWFAYPISNLTLANPGGRTWLALIPHVSIPRGGVRPPKVPSTYHAAMLGWREAMLASCPLW